MLQDWDFEDAAINGTRDQINRQKSARDLEASVDASSRSGTFRDPKDRDPKKRTVVYSASLVKCDCHDFNFIGNNPRKAFRPCMHIYRLAMELGLLEAKYEKAIPKERMVAQANAEKKRLVDRQLHDLGRDPSKWGTWNSAVHEEPDLQMRRQYRAYRILGDKEYSIHKIQGGVAIRHDGLTYTVTLSSCNCSDFRERLLPCKHIYVAALVGGIDLPLSRSDFTNYQAMGQDHPYGFEDA